MSIPKIETPKIPKEIPAITLPNEEMQPEDSFHTGLISVSSISKPNFKVNSSFHGYTRLPEQFPLLFFPYSFNISPNRLAKTEACPLEMMQPRKSSILTPKLVNSQLLISIPASFTPVNCARSS